MNTPTPGTTSAREWYVRIALGISGIVIAAPGIIGALSANGIELLYKTGPLPQLDATLLQHRAVLLMLIGVLLLAAIRLSHLRTTAIAIAIFSNVSFIVFTLIHRDSLQQLALVAGIDVALTILLVLALALQPKEKSAL